MKKILIVILGLSSWQTFAQQTQSDSYTRYELLDPKTDLGSFRIIYDVTATAEGAQYYWNTLRIGSEHTVDEVIDLYTGQALKWDIVDGPTAKSNGHENANNEYEYLQVVLARPVPDGGESRLRIDKTYKDTASYFATKGELVFERSLGIRRNAVVLPKGYEVSSVNYPSQVALESDGRLRLSFMNDGTGAVSYKIKAKKLKDPNALLPARVTDNPWPDYVSQPQGRDKTKARVNYSPTERTFQDREIVYFLQEPETHSFRLYHDYTESRPGVDKYLNIVRAGSKASKPSAKNLDTGEDLLVKTLRGKQISSKGIELENLDNDTEVIVIWFDPVDKGRSTRLRIEETYTDPNRYLEHNDELIWDRSFGRNRNTVVLPKGWFVTTNSIPAKISQSPDGLVQLEYVNPRPDNIDVFIKARRRQ